MRGFTTTVVGLALAVVAAGLAPASVAAQDFSAKNVSLIIGAGGGGSTDIGARIFGKLLTKHLPGEPAIVYRNIAAGGGVQALNYFAANVKPDGVTVLASSGTALEPETLRRQAAKYDPRKFIMIGAVPGLGGVLVVNQKAASRLTDPKAKPVVMGDLSGLRGAGQMAVWGPAFLGWNIRWVVGYASGGALALALKSNEVEALAPIGLLSQITEGGSYVYPSQVGLYKDGTFFARPDFKDVPVFSDLIRPKLSGAALEAYEVWEAIVQVGKWYALQENTAAPIVAAYRATWEKIVADQEFDAAMKLEAGDYTTISGEEMEKTVRTLASASDASLDFINDLRKKVGIPIETQK